MQIVSNAGEISAPLRKRRLPGTTNPQEPYVLRIPVFVENYRRSSKRGKKAELSRRVRSSTGTKSHLETLAAWTLKAHQIPDPVREHAFHPERKWRWDFCWVDHMVALEIEGGIWLPKGAHSGGMAITRDCEKSNEAQILGWTIIRATEAHIRDGSMIGWVKRALGV